MATRTAIRTCKKKKNLSKADFNQLFGHAPDARFQFAVGRDLTRNQSRSRLNWPISMHVEGRSLVINAQ